MVVSAPRVAKVMHWERSRPHTGCAIYHTHNPQIEMRKDLDTTLLTLFYLHSPRELKTICNFTLKSVTAGVKSDFILVKGPNLFRALCVFGMQRPYYDKS